MSDSYRGWLIFWDYGQFTATGPNYGASYEGPEIGWVENGEIVSARTREALLGEIDAWLKEHTAMTPEEQTAFELAQSQPVEDYIAGLTWSEEMPASVRGLVEANLRGFWGHVLAFGPDIFPLSADDYRMIDDAWERHKAAGPASVDTHPQGGNSPQSEVPFMGSAVPAAEQADAPPPPNEHTKGDH
jgi:hypothetical protein